MSGESGNVPRGTSERCVADVAIQIPKRFVSAANQAAEEGVIPRAPTTEGTVFLPEMCDRCIDAVGERVGRATGYLLAPVVMMTLCLFHVALQDVELASEDVQGVAVKLQMHGCMACRYPRAFRQLIRFTEQRGIGFLANLSKLAVTSRGWDTKDFARRR